MNAPSIEPALVLGPELNGTLMTPEEFDAVEEYDEDYRYELIHGVLVVNPIPSEAEVDPNEQLGHLLRLYKETHPQGAAMDSTLPERYVRTRDSRRRADRVIWAGLGRLPVSKQDVPTIVVEFVSWGRRNRHRDYVEKQQEYLAIGVREYWVIDRFHHRMTVFGQGATGGTERVLADHETYETPLLPGFNLALAPLFRIADQWK